MHDYFHRYLKSNCATSEETRPPAHRPFSPELRASELRHLDGKTYIDHAGSALYSASQIAACFEDLKSNLITNPHSQHGLSASGHEAELRRLTLEMLNASDSAYEVVFTTGATGALSLLADSFPWSSHSQFLYSVHSHNSILGMREKALDSGSIVKVFDLPPLDPPSYTITSSFQRQVNHDSKAAHKAIYHLLAMPSECNFSGVKFDLEASKRLLEEVGYGKCLTLIDAAKGCTTNPPDLSRHNHIDFLVLSYYKIFGYPTGLGALIVKKSLIPLLLSHRGYFGGGTVLRSSAAEDVVDIRHGFQGMEDGTPNFLAIAAAKHGFAHIASLAVEEEQGRGRGRGIRAGFRVIEEHSFSIAYHLANMMGQMRHLNGQPVAVIYGNWTSVPDQHLPNKDSQGPTVTFNILRSDGSFVGFNQVVSMAAAHGILMRGGAFCNPGACAKALGLDSQDLHENYEAGHVCWDGQDIGVNGKPTGAVRASFGSWSVIEDADQLIKLISSFFIESSPSTREEGLMIRVNHDETKSRTISHIFVYPVKSCAPQQVTSWPIGPNGLLYDREWAIFDQGSGRVVTQKTCPKMATLSASVDLENQTLCFKSSSQEREEGIATGLKTLTIRFASNKSFPALIGDGKKPGTCDGSASVLVCGSTVEGCRLVGVDEVLKEGEAMEGAEDPIRSFFAETLGLPSCRLVRAREGARKVPQMTDVKRKAEKAAAPGQGRDESQLVGFANDGQYLLVSAASLKDLKARLSSSSSSASSSCLIDERRFRANLVVAGLEAYEEESWTGVEIIRQGPTDRGGQVVASLDVLGTCPRCDMLQVDQESGVKGGPDILLELARIRRLGGRGGRMSFGVLCANGTACSGDDGEKGSGRVLLKVGDLIRAKKQD